MEQPLRANWNARKRLWNSLFGATWNARKCLWNSPLGLIGTRVSAYGTISLGTLYRKSTALKAKGERAGAISKFAKRFRDLCGKKAAGRVWAMRVHQEGRNDLQLCCSWADFRFRAPHSSRALWGRGERDGDIISCQ